jgi:gamma-glutamylcyclotransferase (GGCT)/AIG2-like uncharacterized protein YtfP
LIIPSRPIPVNQQTLFVYGTLRRGSPHEMARFLAGASRWHGSGRAPGRLYHLGWYPGLVEPQADGEWVRGDVFELHEPEKTLPLLDEYEGCGQASTTGFERRRVTVQLDAGLTLSCWAYLYRGQPGDAQWIVSGDYLA